MLKRFAAPCTRKERISLEQFALPCAREERISLELVLKLEIALSNVEESGDSRGFRTGSSKNAVRHEADPANQFERCSSKDTVRHEAEFVHQFENALSSLLFFFALLIVMRGQTIWKLQDGRATLFLSFLRNELAHRFKFSETEQSITRFKNTI